MNGAIVIILLGPGKLELRRFALLIDSLCYFERDYISRSALILVSDTDYSVLLTHLETLPFKQVILFDNPFTTVDGGKLVYDRIAAGFLTAMRHVVKMEGYEFVLKIDPDAVVCGRFADRIKVFFDAHPLVGMVGSFRHDPDGALRSSRDWWAKAIRRTCGLLPFETIRFHLENRIPVRFPLTIKRWISRYLLLRKALRRGWTCGDNILGGAYALSPSVIETFRNQQGLFDDVFQFEGTRLPDDLVMPMYVAAAGFDLGEFNRPGEVFGVWYQKPTVPLHTIAEAGYGFIHSVKDEDWPEEEKMRAVIAHAARTPAAVDDAGVLLSPNLGGEPDVCERPIDG